MNASLLRYFMVSILVLACNSLLGQFDSTYTAVATHSERLDQVSDKLKAAHKLRMAHVDEKAQPHLFEAMETRHTSTIKRFEHEDLLSSPFLDQYIDNILREILGHNQAIQGEEINVLLSRAPWPNASSLGEGTILLNIGLIGHLENESQLAFVLCHEIAHYLLNHVDNSIEKRVAILESSAFKQQVKDISKMEYGARTKALELLKEIQYGARRHGRMFEAQADSFALVLLLPTRYEAHEALKCLGILDNIDAQDPTPIDFKKIFERQNFTFDPDWLKVEQAAFGAGTIERDFDLDSLKTHPDCAKRIALLAPSFEAYTAKNKQLNLQSNADFNLFALTCTFELGRSYLHYEDFGKALYQSLLLLQKYPENHYAIGITGQCLNWLYLAQKSHSLGKYVEMPDEELGQQYNLVLNFIQNLQLSEFKRIGRAFLENRENPRPDPQLLYAWWENCKINENIPAQTAAAQLYLKHYPEGEFATIINSK